MPLGGRSYSIYVGPGLLARLGKDCGQLGLGKRCAVLTDANVAPLYGDAALEALRGAGIEPLLVTVPAGQRAKDLRVVARCYDQLAAHRLERSSFVVALGGGVVGDLAGFVAATWLRGVAFVQVPTTLLAQVDKLGGGKSGVNLKAGKNLVGAFHQPRLVLCDLDTLVTLPEGNSGPVSRKSSSTASSMTRPCSGGWNGHRPAPLAGTPGLWPVIARCCEIKAEVVGQDETETGLRAILNFGHTIGHGLEASSRYGTYLHGEAISIGQVAAAWLSAINWVCPPRISNAFDAFSNAPGCRVTVRLKTAQERRLFEAMRLDKKSGGGGLRFVLAEAIGRVRLGQPVPESPRARAVPST